MCDLDTGTENSPKRLLSNLVRKHYRIQPWWLGSRDTGNDFFVPQIPGGSVSIPGTLNVV